MSALLFSYEIMVKCWRYESKERPSFDILVENIDNFIQRGLDNVSVSAPLHHATYLIFARKEHQNLSSLCKQYLYNCKCVDLAMVFCVHGD